MPQRFDYSEQQVIRQKLRQVGHGAFVRKGVAQTTIDELAAGAHIGKGSFYKFYASKHLLFFELLEQFQNDLRAPLVSEETLQGQLNREHFEVLAKQMFETIASEPLIMILGNEKEFGAILSKLQQERLLEHQRKDQAFLDQLIGIWSVRKTKPERDQVAAQMTMLILICLQRGFFGDRLLPHAKRSAIKGLVDCFF